MTDESIDRGERAPASEWPATPAWPAATSCITCGDVAVTLDVVSVDGADAVCRADDGGTELVAIELVAPVAIGDRLLVHARVALEKLASATG